MNEEELNIFLNYFTRNNVQIRRDRKKEALDSWNPIVEAILVYVRQRHDFFATLRVLHYGSYYERTKVGEPDEFDLMLVMESAVFYELKGPGSNPPIGKADLFLAYLHTSNVNCVNLFFASITGTMYSVADSRVFYLL